MPLKNKALKGIAWTSLSQVGQQMIRFIIGVVLARLLSPEEFGLMGMILVFVGFAGLLSDFGFTSAIIQKSEITTDHLSSIFWVNVLIGSFIASLLIVLAPLIANFYGYSILESITRLVALTFLINSFNMVQKAIVTKKLQFHILAFRNLLSIIVSGFVAILLAINGFGIWSLAWQSIVASLTGVILLWSVTDWRPKFQFSGNAIKELLPYSTNLVGSTFINYWMRNLDNLLLGKFLDSNALGLYARAYGLMLLPMKQISQVIGVVMFPVLSSIKEDVPRVKKVFLKTINAIALLSFPIFFGLLVVADDFILAVYGQKWVQVIPILKILCVIGAFQSIQYANAWIFTSQGRTDLLLRWSLFSGLFLVAAFIIGIAFGTISQFVYSYSVASLLLIYPSFSFAGRIIDLKFIEIIKTLLGTLACTLVMACSIVLVRYFFLRDLDLWPRLIVAILVGVITYPLAIHMSQLSVYVYMKDMLLEKIKKR